MGEKLLRELIKFDKKVELGKKKFNASNWKCGKIIWKKITKKC